MDYFSLIWLPITPDYWCYLLNSFITFYITLWYAYTSFSSFSWKNTLLLHQVQYCTGYLLLIFFLRNTMLYVLRFKSVSNSLFWKTPYLFFHKKNYFVSSLFQRKYLAIAFFDIKEKQAIPTIIVTHILSTYPMIPCSNM